TRRTGPSSPEPATRSVERMAPQDRLVAVRAGRHDVDRRTRDFGEPLEIAFRVGGQRVPVAHTDRALAPARHLLVHRLAVADLVGTERQQVERAPAASIRSAQLDGRQPVEDVELGYDEARDAVELDRALERRRVEPAASARPAGDGAELFADGGQVRADLIVQFGRERARAD